MKKGSTELTGPVGGPTLPTSDTCDQPHHGCLVCSRPDKSWVVYSIQRNNFYYASGAIYLLRSPDHIDGFAQIRQEAYSFRAMDLRTIRASDQLLFHHLLYGRHHFHGLSPISTCQRPEYELRECCSGNRNYD